MKEVRRAPVRGLMGVRIRAEQSCGLTSGKLIEVRGERAPVFIISFGKKCVSLKKGEDKNKTCGFK